RSRRRQKSGRRKWSHGIGWKRSWRAWKGMPNGGKFRWINRRPLLSGECGRSSNGFHVERRGRTAKSREPLASLAPSGQLRGHALRIPFRLLCHATEWYARMEILPDTGGDYREKRNYWSASGVNSRCEKRKNGHSIAA